MRQRGRRARLLVHGPLHKGRRDRKDQDIVDTGRPQWKKNTTQRKGSEAKGDLGRRREGAGIATARNRLRQRLD